MRKLGEDAFERFERVGAGVYDPVAVLAILIEPDPSAKIFVGLDVLAK